MSNAIIDTAVLSGIADAIRDKTGETAPIKLGEMAGKIESISGGGGGNILAKVVGEQSTASGAQYSVSSADLDGATKIIDYAFRGCMGLSSISFPSSVASIGNYAFYGCRSLTEITITNNIVSIYSSAFTNCSKLETIICVSENPPALSATSSLPGTSVVQNIYVPAEAVERYKKATTWSSYAAKISAIPE